MKNSKACNNDLRRMMQIMGIVENRQLFSEINEAHKEYTNDERKKMLVVEKLHIAAFDYSKVIDEIIEYIEDYIFISDFNSKTSSGKLGWKFTIPEYITKKIDFIKKLEINVSVVSLSKEGDTKNKFGEGEINFGDFHFITGGKIGYIKMNIHGISIDDELVDYTIRNTLYHELNHAYEVYRRQETFEDNGDLKVIPSVDADKRKSVQLNLTNDKYGHMMQSIFYRLWDKSELSAAATSVYSFLKSNGGERSRLSIDLLNTQAYHEYILLKEYIDELTKYWGENFWEKYHQLYDKKQNRGTQFFKNWFLKRSRLLLKTYFHYMLSAASAYYEEIEERMDKGTALRKCCEKKIIKK